MKRNSQEGGLKKRVEKKNRIVAFLKGSCLLPTKSGAFYIWEATNVKRAPSFVIHTSGGSIAILVIPVDVIELITDSTHGFKSPILLSWPLPISENMSVFDVMTQRTA